MCWLLDWLSYREHLFDCQSVREMPDSRRGLNDIFRRVPLLLSLCRLNRTCFIFE